LTGTPKIETFEVANDGPLILARFVDGIAQRDKQAFARHLQQVARCLAGRLIEISRGVAPQLQDVHLFVDERARRGVARGDDPVGFALRLRLAARGGMLRARGRPPPDFGIFFYEAFLALAQSASGRESPYQRRFE
jgi:hypothetical protein